LWFVLSKSLIDFPDEEEIKDIDDKNGWFEKDLKSWYFTFLIVFQLVSLPVSGALQICSVFRTAIFKPFAKMVYKIILIIVIFTVAAILITVIILAAGYSGDTGSSDDRYKNYHHQHTVDIALFFIGASLAIISALFLSLPHFYFCHCIVKLLSRELLIDDQGQEYMQSQIQ
jgi:heme/copper-type cytochrome/quinol oxidase subunit 2